MTEGYGQLVSNTKIRRCKWQYYFVSPKNVQTPVASFQITLKIVPKTWSGLMIRPVFLEHHQDTMKDKETIRRRTHYILYGIHSSTVSFSICCLVFMRQLDYTNIRKLYICTTCISRAMCCFVSCFREAEFCGGPSCVIRKSSRTVGTAVLRNIDLYSLVFSIPINCRLQQR
jgi:hypothetical protein